MYGLLTGVKCECVVTDEGNGILEIKNIATEPEYQGKGYGKALIDFVAVSYTHLDVYKRQRQYRLHQKKTSAKQ